MTRAGVSWFIARRFFMTARRSPLLSFISTIAIAGVCLGTAALIIALSILDGFEREIKEKVISFTSHIHVTGYGSKPLDDPDRSVGILRERVPGIRSIMPYAAREGMIRSRLGVEGVYLKGIDTSRDDGRLRAQITEGAYFSGGRGRGGPAGDREEPGLETGRVAGRHGVRLRPRRRGRGGSLPPGEKIRRHGDV